MRIDGKKLLIGIKEYVVMTLGLLLYVVSWNLFMVPNNLIGGGVSGLASIVQYATNGAIRIGTTYFCVNIFLLILAVFTLGKSFGSKTIYAVIVTSIGLNVFQDIIPQSIIQSLAIDNGKLMSTIMGGSLVGVGIGLTMSQGGSTGGTDIIALIVNKYRGVSPGRMLLAIDACIIISSLMVPSYTQAGELMPFAEKVTTVVYAFILVVVCATVLDWVLSGSKQSVQMFIFSKKSAEIADAITTNLHRGVTVLDGKGWYTKQTSQVLMVLTRKSDLNLFLKCVKSIDPEAFLSVASVMGVYGQGFDTIKLKAKKVSDSLKERK